jgi:eukaryotic-like serine/threonine-protein kinase
MAHRVLSTRGMDPAFDQRDGRIGRELNEKWTLRRLLGIGGTCAVYEAVHRNGRRAAVKILSNPLETGRVGRMLVARESRLANAIRHPGVVEILDDDIAEDGAAYIVMELLEGETLEERRRRMGGAIPFWQLLPIFEQLLAVLEVAHEHGIVHRDIKPDNVFVTSFGQVKVLDFGLAADSPETKSGPWFGTPGFMPPEQARGAWSEIDKASDIWAVGATLATTLTGRLVHEGATNDAIVAAAAASEASLEGLDEVIPIRVIDVLCRALAFDKVDRWPNARAMRGALRASTIHRRIERPEHAGVERLGIRDCHSQTRFFQIRRSACDGVGPLCGIVCTACPTCPARADVDEIPQSRAS